jgi:hypothetical protein
MARVFTDAAHAAEDAAVSQNKLKGVMDSMGFGQFTEQVKGYADSLSDKIAIDNDDIAKTQAKIATFKDLAATAGEQEGYFNRVTKAAYDMGALGFGSAEQNAVMLSKAMNSPEQAAALSRTGALTKAEAEHAAELAKSGHAEEARAFIMAAVEKQVSGSAEKNVTATMKMGKAWGDVMETLGTGLLPILEIFANVLTAIPTPLLAVGVGIVGLMVIGALAAPLVGVTAAMWGFTAALLANPITWVVLGIVALIAAIVLLIQNWDTVKNAMSAAWDWIKEKFLLFVDGFKQTWSGLWEAVKAKASEIWNAIKNTIQTGINAVKSVIVNVLNGIKTVWDNTFGALARGVSSAFNKAKSAVESVVKWIGDKVRWALAQIAKLPGGSVITGMLGLASGGPIPGHGSGDTVPLLGTPGEYMLNRQMVAQFGGIGRLEAWRLGRLGGLRSHGHGIQIGNLNMYNPIAEPTSQSLPSAMRQLGYVGVGT